MMSKETESIIQDPSNKGNSRGRGDRSVGKEFASPEQRLEFNPQFPHEKLGVAVMRTLGRQRQLDSWDPLTSQHGLISEWQVNEIPVSEPVDGVPEDDT